MNNHFRNITIKATGAVNLFVQEEIQSLWSGYGSIVRIALEGGSIRSVVAKHVRMPAQNKHPRGWNTDLSHLRKVKSYEVETAWYKNYSTWCNVDCRVPKCLALEAKDNEVFMVMEDLDSSGFDTRLSSVSWYHVEVCLSWLAHFHATFLMQKPEGLWSVGTYWHLETRPDELKVLNDKALKEAAPIIDKKLNEANYQTFVHGDAKLANFCFSADGKKVAAVDFQYVGGGCGMKDVAYFIGSCLNEEDCEKLEDKILDYYFVALRDALKKQGKKVDFDEMENEWRMLYPVAWTDFHRFLKGWSPGHWKINSYSERLAREVLRDM
ncbi:Ecdysteroid kinase [Saccharicrinis carchari]|uniref:Ecdysteroid kinase n=1 Tax=Saccharicrinis carchari TaxID=1168039 RepID=A0A521DML6_SACCC|nr:oxidoreductase family protein [Saccharicrinis carchari]SMO72926.1 Ecdysteroid kinase [Saccharicrinis carchari]